MRIHWSEKKREWWAESAFDEKDTLKAAHFAWDPAARVWHTPSAAVAAPLVDRHGDDAARTQLAAVHEAAAAREAAAQAAAAAREAETAALIARIAAIAPDDEAGLAACAPAIVDREAGADAVSEAFVRHPALTPATVMFLAGTATPDDVRQRHLAYAGAVHLLQDPQRGPRELLAGFEMVFGPADQERLREACAADRRVPWEVVREWPARARRMWAGRVVADSAASADDLAAAWSDLVKGERVQFEGATPQNLWPLELGRALLAHPATPESVLTQAAAELPGLRLFAGAAESDMTAWWTTVRQRVGQPPASLAAFRAQQQEAAAARARIVLAHRDQPVADDGPSLAVDLFAYQRQGVAFLRSQHRALLADEQGVGKTFQFLAAAADAPHVIILSPTSALWQTRGELSRLWPDLDPDRVVAISGTQSAAKQAAAVARATEAQWIFLPYSLAAKYGETLARACAPYALVADEAHKLKNPGSQQGRAGLRLAQGAERVILATGTPLESQHPIDLYPLLTLLGNPLAMSERDFGYRYCDGHLVQGQGRMRTHYDFTGASHLGELQERLAAFMIRRTKADVAPELPPKLIARVPVEISASARREYDQCATDYLAWRAQYRPDASPLQATAPIDLMLPGALRQIAATGKTPAVSEWVRDHLEAGTGKLVVYADYLALLGSLADDLGDLAVTIDGSVTGEAREAARRRFQEDPGVRVLLGQTDTAGLGLTLTAADVVAFVDCPWKATSIAQAFDRIHRVGQTSESVTAVFFEMQGTENGAPTIDSALRSLVLEKQAVADALLGRTSTDLEAAQVSASGDIRRDLVRALGLSKTVAKAEKALGERSPAAKEGGEGTAPVRVPEVVTAGPTTRIVDMRVRPRAVRENDGVSHSH